MEKLTFDAGLQSFRINGGGVLRFNPSDPNLYSRFLEAVEKIRQLETKLMDAQDLLAGMCQADQEIKQQLNWVFGSGNDFDSLLCGVNLLAVAGNGERVITNLLTALQPVLTQGAQRCAGQQVQAAVEKAKKRRAEVC